MSLAEELIEHPTEHYYDFVDGEHTIAVFGLGVNALRSAAELEAVSFTAAPEPGRVDTAPQEVISSQVSLS